MYNFFHRFDEYQKSYRYIMNILLFCALLLAISFLKPDQISKLEEGRFIEKSSGSVIVVRNRTISYDGKNTPYDIWIGKGKRFLSAKAILGDFYSLDFTGKKVPSEFIIENVKNAQSICSVRSGRDEVCFYRTG